MAIIYSRDKLSNCWSVLCEIILYINLTKTAKTAGGYPRISRPKGRF